MKQKIEAQIENINKSLEWIKNNKPQDIVLEEESLDVSKETENILEVKDKLVAKDDVSKNTAIEAIEIDGNGKSL